MLGLSYSKPPPTPAWTKILVEVPRVQKVQNFHWLDKPLKLKDEEATAELEEMQRGR